MARKGVGGADLGCSSTTHFATASLVITVDHMNCEIGRDQLVLVEQLWDHAAVARSDPNDPRLEPVMAALAAVKRAEKVLAAKKDQFAEAVAEAVRAGVRPSAIVRKTEYSAESVRQMSRAKGVDPLRPATVTSIRKLQELQDARDDS